jgi:Cu(I)/Ag(I) efflux system membrane protein CusA/SilA
VISSIVSWCVRHGFFVFAVLLIIGVGSELARRHLARDVLPDLSDPQIVLVADWMGHPATDVSTEVTQVLTKELASVPGAVAVRGSSMTGMAYVDVVFDSSSNLASGRETILQRVAAARSKLPSSVRVQIGPAATSTGWVFQYVLIDPTHGQSAVSLRQMQEDLIRPALASLAGVVEVATVGGHVQQARIEIKPDELLARDLAFTDVLASLPAAGEVGHGGIDEIAARPVAHSPLAGAAPLIKDVAKLRIVDEMPTGVADLDGSMRIVVGGIVIARWDANLPDVAAQVKRTLEGIRPKLPQGVRLITAYDRQELNVRVEGTLVRALAEEVLVVVLVILAFLLDWRGALVPLTTLPLVVLLTFGGMWILRIPATIMSLGGIGIALGLAVDADVVALEACHRRLEGAARSPSEENRRASLVSAALAFTPAILTSLMITGLSFLPVFAFAGETGRLLRPLAVTKTLVIASAALVALTVAPVLRDRFLRTKVVPEFDNPLTRGLVRIYRPLVHFVLNRPALTILTALLAVGSCIPIVGRLGGEFLPRIDEGDLLFMPTTLPGVSAEDAARDLRRFDAAIGQFKEVAAVFGKVGRADTATDPAPASMAETTVRLRPRSEWPTAVRPRWYSGWAPPAIKRVLGLLWPEETIPSTSDLIERLDRATRLPGWTSSWTAPARARLDMMSTGVRTPVGIRIVSPDQARLDDLGTALRALAMRVPGARSAVFESLGQETRLEFSPDNEAIARHGVEPGVVRSTADLLLKGGQIGEIEKDGRRLRLIVVPELRVRGDADQVREVTVRASDRGAEEPVPLALLGRPEFVRRPAMIRSERGEIVAYVYVDLEEGTDLVGYVEQARRELSRSLSAGEIRLDPGERIEWAGQYELLTAGQRRLWWIVPLVVASMLGLLYLQFRSLTEALLVLLSVPFALVGSFWTLFLLGYPLSAPVWVGLLSVVGLAMQTGVVMVVYIDAAFHRRVRDGQLKSREDIVSAHAEGTIQRLRPKIMTITTMASGLLPLLWAQGAGAEIMKRVAAPMIGGLASSAFLTLEILPVLYTIWRHRQLRRSIRTKQHLEAVVGPAPAWARR